MATVHIAIFCEFLSGFVGIPNMEFSLLTLLIFFSKNIRLTLPHFEIQDLDLDIWVKTKVFLVKNEGF